MSGRGKSSKGATKKAKYGVKAVDQTGSIRKRSDARSRYDLDRLNSAKQQVSSDTVTIPEKRVKRDCQQQLTSHVTMGNPVANNEFGRNNLTIESNVKRGNMVNLPSPSKMRTRSKTKSRERKHGDRKQTNKNATVNLMLKQQIAKNKTAVNVSKNLTGDFAAEERQELSTSFDGDGIDVNVSSDEFAEEEVSSNRNMTEDSSSDSESVGENETDMDEAAVILGVPLQQNHDEAATNAALNNPYLKNLLDKMLEEKLKQVGLRTDSTSTTHEPVAGCSNQGTPKTTTKVGNMIGVNKIKSPSDTTIYRPALKRRNISGEPGIMNVDMTGQQTQIGRSSDIDRHVDYFVETVRREQQSQVNVPGLDQAKERVDNTILEAEKFKAMIMEPKGKLDQVGSVNNSDTIQGNNSREGVFRDRDHSCEQVQDLYTHQIQCNGLEMQRGGLSLNKVDHDVVCQSPNDAAVQDVGTGISDDDFFHLTCHIEPALFQKIERGEFVDLDKLLPKKN